MANTVIQLKKSAVPSSSPAALANGELAINYADGKLYYKNLTGEILSFNSYIVTPASFSTVNANGSLVVAGGANSTLTLITGNNIQMTSDIINDTITISADLTAANGWANTKLANSTVTLAGSLTTTGSVTSNGYVYITPSDGINEGGEIQLQGTDTYTSWSIDAYQNNYRVFARTGSTVSNVNFFHALGGGTVRMGVNKTDPAYTVDVSGDVNITGSFRVNGTPLSTGTVDLTPANNWANTKVATVTSNSNSRLWANTSIDGNSNENVYLDLSTSGVTAATYGSSTNIPIVTVDAYGRITTASNVAFSGGASVGNEAASSSAFYPVFTNTTSGTLSTANVSSTKLSFVPSNGTLTIVGSLFATTKSFLIEHPTKEGMKLRYGSLEGPENGVYLRGRISGQNFIEYPEYWSTLVDINTTTVQLTPIGDTVMPKVAGVLETGVLLSNDNRNIDCYYLIMAERKDVDKLIVEF